MLSHIRTSKKNKEVVSQLTRKLNLGAENTIARMAFSVSLSTKIKLDLSEIQNSGGKEYSKAVLFGDHENIYLGMICVHYNLYKTDPDIPKYIKMHIDHGLELLNQEMENKSIDPFEFIKNKLQLK